MILGPTILGGFTLLLGIPVIDLILQTIRKKDSGRTLTIVRQILNFICVCPSALFVITMLAASAGGIPDLINPWTPSFCR